jgi:hypothetical protein
MASMCIHEAFVHHKMCHYFPEKLMLFMDSPKESEILLFYSFSITMVLQKSYFAILDCGKICGEMWTFLPKTTRHFDKSGICGFGPDKIHKSKYLRLI